MYPALLSQAVLLASRTRFRDGRSYTLGSVGVRTDGAIVQSTNGWSVGPNPRMHAESRLLRKLGRGGRLYVARVRRDGSIAMAKPCKGCALMLRHTDTACWFTIDGDSYGCID